MSDEQVVFNFLLILTRSAATIAFLPVFARRQLPHMVKAGLAVGLTCFWFGAIPQEMMYQGSTDFVFAGLLLGKETAIGFILANIVGVILVPARVAGAYVGTEMGLSLAAVSSPGSADSSNILSSLFEVLAILIFFNLDMHHILIRVLHRSMLDMNNMQLSSMPTEGIAQMFNDSCSQGIQLGGSVGICLFLLTVVLGLLNKAAPALNLFSIGMTLRTGIGLFCLCIFLPNILDALRRQYFDHAVLLESMQSYFT